MTNMVDRIAQTLHDLTIKNGGVSRGAHDMKADAVAILEAMREPTPGIINVLSEMIDPNSDTTVGQAWSNAVDSMISGEANG